MYWMGEGKGVEKKQSQEKEDKERHARELD